MNAKAKNASEKRLFLDGGRLDILLWGYRELDRQVDELMAERRQAAQLRLEVEECPCGCGLKNDICDAHLDAVAQANEELPF